MLHLLLRLSFSPASSTFRCRVVWRALACIFTFVSAQFVIRSRFNCRLLPRRLPRSLAFVAASFAVHCRIVWNMYLLHLLLRLSLCPCNRLLFVAVSFAVRCRMVGNI